MKNLKKYTTSTGNHLEFNTSELYPDSIFVLDTDCQMERIYTIGLTGILNEDFYTDGKATLIENFDQVINAWVNEEIHF